MKTKLQILIFKKSWLTHLQHYEAVTVSIILGTDSIVREAESYSILEGELLRSFLVKVSTLLEPVGRDAAEGTTDETTKETILLHSSTSTVNDNIQRNGSSACGGWVREGEREREGERRESTSICIMGTSTNINDGVMDTKGKWGINLQCLN